MNYWRNQRGLTLLNLLCFISFAGIITAVASPLAEQWHQDEQVKVTVGFAVSRVRQAAIAHFMVNGVWPDRQTWADFLSRLPKLPINPHDGQRIAVYHGRPKRPSDVVWGSIRVYPSEDGQNLEIVGYGRDGREIGHLSCFPL